MKESVASRFVGKRIDNVISLVGIAYNHVGSYYNCYVEISNFTTEIFFHVLLDAHLRSDTLLGRVTLNNCFRVSLLYKRTYKYAHDSLRKMPESQVPIDVVEDDKINDDIESV